MRLSINFPPCLLISKNEGSLGSNRKVPILIKDFVLLALLGEISSKSEASNGDRKLYFVASSFSIE